MTVEESPISPAGSATAPGGPKSKMVNAGSNTATAAGGSSATPMEGTTFPHVNNDNTFEAFAQASPSKADELLNKLTEVTGVTDRPTLCKAFNQSRKSDQRRDFNVTHAIEWLLQLPSDYNQPTITATPAPVSSVEQQNQQQQRLRQKTPLQEFASSPSSSAVAMANNSNMSQNQHYAPPNSPTIVGNSSGNAGDAPEVASEAKPLVDLTGPSNGPNANQTVDTDLEKAIQLSLQEAKRTGGESFGVTKEEEDVSRALEASLMENQFGPKGARGMMIDYVDPLNPHERKRCGMWPVGLKNVGQTCWFSAVIQSLFYIPSFRSLVLNFPPPKEVDKLLDDRQRKIVEFMLELRKLFAFMVGSARKYVDPSRAVDILRGFIGFAQTSSSSSTNKDILNIETNNQQDVSEFTHIVLEWVEDAFKGDSKRKSENCTAMQTDEGEPDADAGKEKENNEEKDPEEGSAASKNDNSENPMAKLFYGKVLREGRINGDDFMRQENFGQWPLQVNTCINLHESLEKSLAHQQFDEASSTNSAATLESGQELWFTKLPPVLFLELSRFQYNMERKTAEKIHNRLEFPERLFMDRYVSLNKAVTKVKREEVRALKERRAALKSKLDKFTHYGQNLPAASTMPLPDILQRTLDFAQQSQQQSFPNKPGNAVAALAASSLMQVDSPVSSPKMTPASSLSNLANTSTTAVATVPSDQALVDGDEAMEVEMSGAEVAAKEDEMNGCDSVVSKLHDAEAADPAPKHVTEVELRLLQDCLTRWKTEVEQDIQSLESAIQSIEHQIETMYTDESLRQLEYQLHAVMVHEGSVDSGHYWAYVFDHRRKVWLKFNDNAVNEASWDELAKESMGGHSNTSAYSLVYIDTSKPELLMDSCLGETREERMDQGELELLAVTLPNDLAQYVVEDNDAFHKEIGEWDQKQQQIETNNANAENSSPHQVVPIASNLFDSSSGSCNDVLVVEEKLTYVNNHAKLSLVLTKAAVKHVEAIIKDKGPQTAVLTALEKVIGHYCDEHKKENAPAAAAADGSSCGGSSSKAELLPQHDSRLESFVYYLLRNDETKNMPLVELAVLEQFSFPGLDNNTPLTSAFRNAADACLQVRRTKYPEDAKALKQWHQAYHFFRRSVHCFVNGLDRQLNAQFPEALDHYTEAYNYTVKANNVPVTGSARALKESLIIRHLCKVLPHVNRALIEKFRKCDNFEEVKGLVRELVVPVLFVLQSCVDKQQNTQPGYTGLDSQTLEEVRTDWCALVGETDTSNEASNVISEIIPMILLDAASTGGQAATDNAGATTSKNSSVISQSLEMSLSARYKEVVGNLRSSSETSTNLNIASSQ